MIELFKRLLGFRSVTPHDGGSLEFIREYLKDFEAIWINRYDVKNLFLYKKFSPGEHLCFGGHVDVVPPGEGWESDPFDPVVKNGRVFARGAQDMKSGVAAFLQAVKECKEFRGTLSVLLTSDEEGDAKYGTALALEELKRIGMVPDYAVVAEPTCEKVFGDAIKIGRRGSINGVIEKIGKQGHAAYPEKAINPIHEIAKVLPRIAGAKLDEGDEYFAPSRFVITDIRAGMEVTNVTPGRLKMMFNVRNSTKTSIEDIKRFVEKEFANMNYTLKLTQSAKPFMTDPESKIVRIMQDSVHRICSVEPKLSTAGGTSDARFFGEFGVKTVEFGVVNDKIHAPNESCPVEEVKKLYEIFSVLLKRF